MIDKIKVLEIVKDSLEGSDKFLVSLKITTDNRILSTSTATTASISMTNQGDDHSTIRIVPPDIKFKK